MEVAAWLKGLGLEVFAEVFEENGIDASLLPELTNDDLKDLGVSRLADRKKLLKAIAQLAGTDTDTSENPPPELPRGERRQVTVLFADLTNFTGLSSELGAEAMHDLLNRYFTALDGIVVGYGGSIDKHIGDNVMAVFGAPSAHHNDPERAVRAARDMHASIQQLSLDMDRDLQAHIGIASGQVVAGGTGSDAYREYTVTGETVNLASRLQDLAGGGETFLSDDVARATATIAEYASVGNVDVKGFPRPVPVLRFVALHEANALKSRSPFVDRTSERNQFSSQLAACAETGSGQTTLIRGEAGIGKSRLIAQFETMAAALGFHCYRAQVHDFGVRQGQDAIASLIRGLLPIAGDKSVEERVPIVDEFVAENGIDADQHACLNDLLGHPQTLALRSLYDAMDNATRSLGKQALLCRLIEKASAHHPVMITVEDVHWSSAQTLSLLAHIAGRLAACPVLLLLTSRVDGDPIDQHWRSSLKGSPIMTFDLGTLPDGDARAVARAFPECDESTVETCIERAGGNPLFLEQLLLDANQSTAQEVPGSIQSLVQARMDRLDAVDKDALQAASVIGMRAPLDMIRMLIDKPSYDVGSLYGHNLLSGDGDECLFAHALIRDCVYSTLLRDRRQKLHGLAADWFRDRDAVLYARHLDRAGAPEAAAAYHDAAGQEAKAYRFEHALDLVDQGLLAAATPEDRFRLTLLRGDLLRELGQPRDAIETFRSLTGLPAEDLDLCRAWIGVASCVRILGGYEEGIDALAQAEPLASHLDAHKELADISYYLGCLQFAASNVEECLVQHQRSCEAARKAGDSEREARALSGLGDAYYGQGVMTTALSVFQDCQTLCREYGFGRIDVGSGHMIGVIRRYLNDFEDAIRDVENAVAMAATVGNTRTEMIASIILGELHTDHGDPEQAYAALDRARGIADGLGNPRYRTYALYEMGLALWHDPARRDEAGPVLDEALTLCRTIEMSFLGPRILAAQALVVDDAEKRRSLLAEGEAIVKSGCNAHNGLWFYRYAAEASLNAGDWDAAERYAGAMETYPPAVSLPWAEFFVARARLLAAFGRGGRDPATANDLRALKTRGEMIGLRSALPALNKAVTAV